MKKYVIFILAGVVLVLLAVSPLRQVYAPFKYRKLIKHYAAQYGIDWLLVASIVYYESRFKKEARSSKGACGLMQIMPATGEELARRMGWDGFSPDELFNPRENLELGCYYFSGLLTEFGGNAQLALAAYNAGKGNILKWYGESRDDLPGSMPDKTDYKDIEKYVYPETRRYVNKVINAYRMLKMMNRVWRL